MKNAVSTVVDLRTKPQTASEEPRAVVEAQMPQRENLRPARDVLACLPMVGLAVAVVAVYVGVPLGLALHSVLHVVVLAVSMPVLLLVVGVAGVIAIARSTSRVLYARAKTGKWAGGRGRSVVLRRRAVQDEMLRDATA